MCYLFEKQGEVTIPEMVFTWYNPAHEKLYKRTLKAVTIQMEPNPDLGMLATVRDSLAQEQILEETAGAEPKKILGMSLKRFAFFGVGILAGLILLFKLVHTLYVRQRAKRQAYLVSERYFFNRIKKSLRTGDAGQISTSLYRWIDSMQLDEPSVGYFLRKFGAKAKMEFATISLGEWEKVRQSYLDCEAPRDTDWINP